MTQHANNVVSLYERNAAAWTRARAAAQHLQEAGWIERFEALLPTGGMVLDIGCGSGRPLASHFIARGFDVVGIDAAPTLIDICRSQFPDQTWFVADMRTLSLDRTFDGLLAWDSMFHLSPDHQRRMFDTFRAHAAAGAALMFTSGNREGEAIGSFESEPLYHASLEPDTYRDLLQTHGFTVVSHLADDPQCGGRTVWLAQAVA